MAIGDLSWAIDPPGVDGTDLENSSIGTSDESGDGERLRFEEVEAAILAERREDPSDSDTKLQDFKDDWKRSASVFCGFFGLVVVLSGFETDVLCRRSLFFFFLFTCLTFRGVASGVAFVSPS